MTSLAIVGSWVNGQFIPSDETVERPFRANDVVESDGEYYRMVDCGTKFQLWKVTADVVTSLFFSQVMPLEMAVN